MSKKYKVEKVVPKFGEIYWAIWMGSNDAVFWDEDSANLACEALNMHSGLKKMKSKAMNLASALEDFNKED